MITAPTLDELVELAESEPKARGDVVLAGLLLQQRSASGTLRQSALADEIKHRNAELDRKPAPEPDLDDAEESIELGLDEELERAEALLAALVGEEGGQP